MRKRMVTERQIDSRRDACRLLKVPIRQSARNWFNRKPYAQFDLRRGDSGGQENIESVSSTAEGDTETEKGYREIGGTIK